MESILLSILSSYLKDYVNNFRREQVNDYDYYDRLILVNKLSNLTDICEFFERTRNHTGVGYQC